MLSANVECQYGATGCPQGFICLHMGLHMAAQELYMAAYGCPKAAYDCSEGALGWPWGCIWLLRGCNGVLWAGHGAASACSEAAMGCPWGCEWLVRGCIWLQRVAFRCRVAVCGSHTTDMQYMLRLAGPGWAARILRTCPGEGSWVV